GDDHNVPFDQHALALVLTEGKTFTSTIYDGHHIRVASIARKEKGIVVEVAQFAANLDGVDSSVEKLRIILLGILPLALVVTSLLGVWLTNRALHPVREIAEAAERLEAEHLSDRLPVRGKDEFAILSSQFNSMLDRIEGSFQRLGTAYEAQRRFIAD